MSKNDGISHPHPHGKLVGLCMECCMETRLVQQQTIKVKQNQLTYLVVPAVSAVQLSLAFSNL